MKVEEFKEIQNVLIEIRNLQRDHLTEYRNMAQRSLELQQQAAKRQEQIGKLYRRVVAAAATLATLIIVLVIYLLGRLPR